MLTPVTPRAGGAPAPPAPGPPLHATPRLLHRLWRARLALVIEARRYGPVTRLRLGPKTMYVVNDPHAASHVLGANARNYAKGIGLVQARRVLGDGVLTSDGPAWKAQRRAVAPSFTPARLADQLPVVAREADALVTRLCARVGTGPTDVTGELTALTLGVLGDALLGADLSGFGAIAEDFEVVQDQAMLEALSLGLLPAWRPTPGGVRFRRAQRRLATVVDEIIDRCDGDGLVARLGDGTSSRAVLRGRVITLLLAGHETTASTLSWALHRLSTRPDLRTRVRDEARAVLGGGVGAVEELRALTVTGTVVSETMRLHPPVWLLPRTAVDDDVVAGHHVPAGSDVVVSPYAIHRDPAWWHKPDEFDPDRFAPGASWPKDAYLPFGAGPHFCVGSNLGTAEAVLVLARLCRDLDLRAVPGGAPHPEPMLSLRGRLSLTVHEPEG